MRATLVGQGRRTDAGVFGENVSMPKEIKWVHFGVASTETFVCRSVTVSLNYLEVAGCFELVCPCCVQKYSYFITQPKSPDKFWHRGLWFDLVCIVSLDSERAKQTEAKGARFEEAKNINKSLLTLGNVIESKHNATCHLRPLICSIILVGNDR